MMGPGFKRVNYLPILHVIFTMIWLSNLSGTDAYFIIYTIIAFCSFFLVFKRGGFCFDAHNNVASLVCAFFFSLAVFLSNYTLFTTIGDLAVIGHSTSVLVNAINSVLCLIGGVVVSLPIFLYFFYNFPRVADGKSDFRKCRFLPAVIFGSLFLIQCIHLFFVEYPGNITEDPFTQISEMVSGSFSNFNTFWHTKLFQIILSFGYAVFSDVNAAVAVFCVFQSFVLCFAFSYALMTMIRLRIPDWVVFVSYCAYAFLPYNIALSITVWKDVLFAAGCLLMISSMLRILRSKDGSQIFDYCIFVLSSLLFIISRTNGWIILLISLIAALPALLKKRFLLSLSAGMVFLGWFLLNPVLGFLNVSGGDLVESLSIPIQQVSRVIADGCDLTAEEEELLSVVVDLDQVPELYVDWLSDPMKVEVRSKNYDYFQDHLSDYTKLWVQLGLRYPWEYVKAWVDQTKGYWNAGYDYPLYSESISDNPYGVVKTGGGNPIASLFRLYFGLSRHVIFFEPLHSIGLHVWIIILCFLLNLKRHRIEWILSLPLLILVIGLWFGTPVYCCFRYVYPLFASFPFVVSTALFSSDECIG